MRWPQVGLRGRLATVVVAGLVGMILLPATLVVFRSERALEKALRERLVAATQQLAEVVSYGTLARSAPLLSESLEPFARTPGLVAIRVYDDQGKLLIERSGPAAQRATLRIEQPVYTRSSLPGSEGAELAAFGLAGSKPKRVGRLIATFSTASTLGIQRGMRRDIIAAFVIIGGIGLLIVLFVASDVVRRVLRLAGAADRVAAGDLEVRVPEDGPEELTRLSTSFNAMTGAIAEQRAALTAAADQLAERESLAAIGRATAVMAHELKNPLGILLGAADVVGNLERSEAARVKAAEIIRDEVKRLDRTLEQLLAFVRPIQPRPRAIEARALCREVVERATLPGAPAAGLSVVVEGEDDRVRVDPQHAHQVLLNLLVNAAQAGAKRIILRVGSTENRAQIEATDDGPGVAPELREKLFRPFVTSKPRGTGLGLAASRRLARENNGELRYQQSPEGARFVFELQRAESSPERGHEV
jgi:signal transduction histidine kinase